MKQIVVPEGPDERAAIIYLRVRDDEYVARLSNVDRSAPPGEALRDAELSVDAALRRLLRGSERLLKARVQQAATIDDFATELADVCARAAAARPSEPLPPGERA